MFFLLIAFAKKSNIVQMILMT